MAEVSPGPGMKYVSDPRGGGLIAVPISSPPVQMSSGNISIGPVTHGAPGTSEQLSAAPPSMPISAQTAALATARLASGSPMSQAELTRATGQEAVTNIPLQTQVFGYNQQADQYNQMIKNQPVVIDLTNQFGAGSPPQRYEPTPAMVSVTGSSDLSVRSMQQTANIGGRFLPAPVYDTSVGSISTIKPIDTSRKITQQDNVATKALLNIASGFGGEQKLKSQLSSAEKATGIVAPRVIYEGIQYGGTATTPSDVALAALDVASVAPMERVIVAAGKPALFVAEKVGTPFVDLAVASKGLLPAAAALRVDSAVDKVAMGLSRAGSKIEAAVVASRGPGEPLEAASLSSLTTGKFEGGYLSKGTSVVKINDKIYSYEISATSKEIEKNVEAAATRAYSYGGGQVRILTEDMVNAVEAKSIMTEASVIKEDKAVARSFSVVSPTDISSQGFRLELHGAKSVVIPPDDSMILRGQAVSFGRRSVPASFDVGVMTTEHPKVIEELDAFASRMRQAGEGQSASMSVVSGKKLKAAGFSVAQDIGELKMPAIEKVVPRGKASRDVLTELGDFERGKQNIKELNLPELPGEDPQHIVSPNVARNALELNLPPMKAVQKAAKSTAEAASVHAAVEEYRIGETSRAMREAVGKTGAASIAVYAPYTSVGSLKGVVAPRMTNENVPKIMGKDPFDRYLKFMQKNVDEANAVDSSSRFEGLGGQSTNEKLGVNPAFKRSNVSMEDLILGTSSAVNYASVNANASINDMNNDLNNRAANINANIQGIEQGRAQSLRQQQSQSQLEKQITGFNSFTPPSPDTTPAIPILGFGFGKHGRKQSLFGKQAYKVLVKQRGKFVEIAEGLPKDVAIERGAAKVESNISATFKIVPEDSIARDIRASGTFRPERFREYSVKRGVATPTPGQFVQLSKYRLSSRGEVSDIQLARRSKRTGRMSML